jgi:hypothetical protein
MFRTVVGVLHVAVAAFTALCCALLSCQAALDLSWEMGFYGEPSPASSAMLGLVVLAGAFALVEAIAGISFARGHRWAAHAIVGISLVVVFMAPLLVIFGAELLVSPFRFFGAVSATGAVLELWRRPAAPPREG